MSDRTAAAPLPLSGNTLPVGHAVREFVIEGLLGEGGFSLVYLARDTLLQRVVAIKEYMPSGLALRNDDHSVSPRSERQRETFELGLRSFINEARLLASFDHPALVKVYQFWEQHGTAYMVMPHYQGPTLKQWLAEQRSPPDEPWLKALLAPLLEALEVIHADHCYHRDIAPDNILLLGPNRPLLLDFGAARRVIGDATRALTIILKPGYAPIEQYAEMPALKQGPWTDVYALCAVLYRAISGACPVPSVGRLMKDDLVPLATLAAGRYSPEFLAAIDAGLAVQPAHRPQNIASLRAAFHTPGVLADDDTLTQQLDDEATVVPPAPLRESEPRPLAPAPASLPDPTARAASAGPAKRGYGWIAGVGSACVILALAALWRLLGPTSSPDSTAIAAAPQLPPAATAGDAPAPPTNDSRIPPSVRLASPALSPASPAPTAAEREPFSVRAVLEELLREADPSIGVTLQTASPRVVINRDQLQFQITSTAAGYLYIFLANADGTQLYRFFPNEFDRANRIAASQQFGLPRNNVKMTADGPPGTDRILAVVSEHPRDFANSGFRRRDSLYDLKIVRERWESQPASALLGMPTCPTARCSARFGAALVQYEVVSH